MSNWLQTKRGVTNLLLSYVIHKDTTPLTKDKYKFIVYNISLTTAVFKADIRKVANMMMLLNGVLEMSLIARVEEYG